MVENQKLLLQANVAATILFFPLMSACYVRYCVARPFSERTGARMRAYRSSVLGRWGRGILSLAIPKSRSIRSAMCLFVL